MRIAHRFIGGKQDDMERLVPEGRLKQESRIGHTYVSNMVHYVFSTKYRQKLITPELEARLWPYMGGIARENNMKAISIGGTEDHTHMLLWLPGTVSVAKAVQLIKGGSSKWVHDQFPKFRDFGWQEGYGAFTIGISQAEETIS